MEFDRFRPGDAAARRARSLGFELDAERPYRAAIPHDRDDRCRTGDRGADPGAARGDRKRRRRARPADPADDPGRRAGRADRLRHVRARRASARPRSCARRSARPTSARRGTRPGASRSPPRRSSSPSIRRRSGLVIGVTHEGGTPATNAALSAARDAGARTAVITVTDRSPAAALADLVVETGELDQSWCHTVGFVSPLVAASAIGGTPRRSGGGRGVPRRGPRRARGRGRTRVDRRSGRRPTRGRSTDPRDRVWRRPGGRARARPQDRGRHLDPGRVSRPRDVPPRPPRRRPTSAPARRSC